MSRVTRSRVISSAGRGRSRTMRNWSVDPRNRRREPAERAGSFVASELLRSREACNHRYAQEVLVGAACIGGYVLQRAPELGRASLEIPLVGDRLRLDVFERH